MRKQQEVVTIIVPIYAVTMSCLNVQPQVIDPKDNINSETHNTWFIYDMIMDVIVSHFVWRSGIDTPASPLRTHYYKPYATEQILH